VKLSIKSEPMPKD